MASEEPAELEDLISEKKPLLVIWEQYISGLKLLAYSKTDLFIFLHYIFFYILTFKDGFFSS